MIVIYLFLATIICLSSSSRVYRQDYVYNRQTDAFYKLHIDSRNRNNAGKICEAEGAKLMVVESDQDVVQFHGMIKKYPDLIDFAWVQEDGKDHDPAPEENVFVLGQPSDDLALPWTGVCEVLSRQGDSESYHCYQQLPFMCKVKAADAFYDSACDVYGQNYKYVESTGSCYRVTDIAYTWNGAYDECQAEGAHLLVLNSEAEAQAVWNLTQGVRHANDAKYHWFLFAGFRANIPTDGSDRVFRTIFNQTLEEAGYNHWSDHEPNNAGGREDCGSVFKNDGKLNDLDCSHAYAFVCEKERHSSTKN